MLQIPAKGLLGYYCKGALRHAPALYNIQENLTLCHIVLFCSVCFTLSIWQRLQSYHICDIILPSKTAEWFRLRTSSDRGYWIHQISRNGKRATLTFSIQPINESGNVSLELAFFFFFLIFRLFVFMAVLTAYGSFQARDWIRASTATYAVAVAMPDPLTHCAWLKIKPMSPQWPKPLQ